MAPDIEEIEYRKFSREKGSLPIQSDSYSIFFPRSIGWRELTNPQLAAALVGPTASFGASAVFFAVTLKV